jgi:hypothetical protein
MFFTTQCPVNDGFIPDGMGNAVLNGQRVPAPYLANLLRAGDPYLRSTLQIQLLDTGCTFSGRDTAIDFTHKFPQAAVLSRLARAAHELRYVASKLHHNWAACKHQIDKHCRGVVLVNSDAGVTR